MHWLDWVIMVVPVVVILWLAIYARKYVRGVADYLAAGRVAGRYVISVGDMETMLGVITLAALVEMRYQTGYAILFWNNLTVPIGIMMALTGYCVYRFRETRALSIGQFLEMRYNRPLRIFAAALRTTSEMMCNAIGPAIAARFFVYFLGIPHQVEVFETSVPSFTIVLFIGMAMAVLILWFGGRISLLVTDCLQGLMCYPIFVAITAYILFNYSWSGEISPVMLDRIPGESFLDPFDIEQLRDFNLFALAVAVIGSILNRASWIGNDTTSSGRSPHEQKMAGVLGAWRNGFSVLMCTLIAAVILTVLNHAHFAAEARKIRVALCYKVAEEAVSVQKTRQVLETRIAAIPEQRHQIGTDRPLSQADNLDTTYLNAVTEVLGNDASGNLIFQKFRTLYNQMMLPVTMRRLMPLGIVGLFCLLMVMLWISTDNSRIFNSSSTIVQDIVLPLRGKPFTPKNHLLLLRLSTLLVALFFFFFSLFFVQLDYINMFVTIMTAIWLGGAGPVMIFGLYSRFGNSTGAFASLLVGSGISTGGMLLQRNWAENIYPFIEKMGWTEAIGGMLEAVSTPLAPYVMWHMDAVKFPINSIEIYFIAILGGIAAYIIGSLLTYREPYNLDRLLHRGIYSIGGDKYIKSSWTWRNTFGKLIGITSEYTRGDKIIAWSVFVYTFAYQIGLCFVAVLIWNLISPWPKLWWSHYFFITSILAAVLIGIVSTVWFMIGGVIDMRRLFRDLAKRMDNPLDDGWVEGHVALVDKSKFDAAAVQTENHHSGRGEKHE